MESKGAEETLLCIRTDRTGDQGQFVGEIGKKETKLAGRTHELADLSSLYALLGGCLAADRDSTEHVSSHATRTWHMFANQQQDCETTPDSPLSLAYFVCCCRLHPPRGEAFKGKQVQRSRGFHVGFQLA